MHDFIADKSAARSETPFMAAASALREQLDHLLEQHAKGGPGARPTSLSIRAILNARRRREEYFDGPLFGEPAWDMLLELFAVELEKRRISVSSLCIASNVPSTTALRWAANLENRGLIKREADPHDGRRIFVKLTDEARSAIQAYFAGPGRALLSGD